MSIVQQITVVQSMLEEMIEDIRVDDRKEHNVLYADNLIHYLRAIKVEVKKLEDAIV